MRREIFLGITIIVISVFLLSFSLCSGWGMDGVERSATVLFSAITSLVIAVVISIILGRTTPGREEAATLATTNVLVAVATVALISGLKIAINVSLTFLFFSFVGITLFAHKRRSSDFVGISLIQVLAIVVVMTVIMII